MRYAFLALTLAVAGCAGDTQSRIEAECATAKQLAKLASSGVAASIDMLCANPSRAAALENRLRELMQEARASVR